MSDDFEARRATVRRMFDHHRDHDMPAWLDDQIAIASREAVHCWLWPPGAPLVNTGHSPDLALAVELLTAALLDCTACPHVLRSNGPMPMRCMLPTRRADCTRCARTFRLSPPDEDDRCDVCGSRGNTWFTQFRFAIGPMVFLGDACDCCAQTLGIER